MKLTYSDYRRIQEMKAAGYCACQAALRLGYTEYGVYKVWGMSEAEFLAVKSLRCEALEKYREFVVEELKKCPLLTSSQILDRIKEAFGEEITVSMASFYRFMRIVRKKEGFVQNNQTRQFKRIATTLPGEEGQVDLGQMKMEDINGNTSKVYFFCLVLSFSRMKYVYFSAIPFDSARFCYAHDKAFRYLGGRPRQLMYDQDRVQVVAENAGDIVFTDEFEKFRRKANFDIYLCKPSDPDTKGKVENVVRYIKTNFLAHRIYNGIDTLNAEALKWLDRTGNGTPHQTTYKTPRQLFEEEGRYLTDYEPQQIDLVKKRIVTVSDTNNILYKRNRYSIPKGKYKQGERLLLSQDDEIITITDPTTNDVVAVHNISEKIGQVVTKKEEAKPMPKIYREMLNAYKDVKYAENFIRRVAEANPRYIREQMYMLKRCEKAYQRKTILGAIKIANANKLFTINDVVAIIIKDKGTVDSKTVIPKRTASKYKEKASMLSKYDSLFTEET